MKKKLSNLLKNPILHMMLSGLIVYLCFIAVILATLQIPPDAILDSGLDEILLVFEG